jgi:hypothetical protein
MHLIFPNEHKWLFVLSCIIVEGDSIPNFYIFKGKQFRHNYIECCESGYTMAMQLRAHGCMHVCFHMDFSFHYSSASTWKQSQNVLTQNIY